MKTIINRWPVAAGIGLVLGCATRLLAPWHATKFIVGLAVITVIVCGVLAYMRHESRKADAAKVEAAKAKVEAKAAS